MWNGVALNCRDFFAKKALIECGPLCNDGLEHGEDSSSASDGSARTPGEKVRVRQEGVDCGAESTARDPAPRASDSPPPCNSVAAFLIAIGILRKRHNLCLEFHEKLLINKTESSISYQFYSYLGLNLFKALGSSLIMLERLLWRQRRGASNISLNDLKSQSHCE